MALQRSSSGRWLNMLCLWRGQLVLGALAEHRAAQLALRHVRRLRDEPLVVAHKQARAVAQLRARRMPRLGDRC